MTAPVAGQPLISYFANSADSPLFQGAITCTGISPGTRWNGFLFNVQVALRQNHPVPRRGYREWR